MIMQLYRRAFKVMTEKSCRVWGITLLGSFLATLSVVLLWPVFGVALAISVLLEVSLAAIFILALRGEEVNSKLLFVTFASWKDIKHFLCGMGWMMLWVLLWSLIPVVGIVFAAIRAYEYRLTPYILLFEPEIAATEAIAVSKQRTAGWKGKMFWADMCITLLLVGATLVLRLLGLIPFIGLVFNLVATVLSIAVPLFTGPLLGLVQASFYDTIALSAAQKETAGKSCATCGAVIAEDAAFCPSCGTKQGEPAPAESDESQQAE